MCALQAHRCVCPADIGVVHVDGMELGFQTTGKQPAQTTSWVDDDRSEEAADDSSPFVASFAASCWPWDSSLLRCWASSWTLGNGVGRHSQRNGPQRHSLAVDRWRDRQPGLPDLDSCGLGREHPPVTTVTADLSSAVTSFDGHVPLLGKTRD